MCDAVTSGALGVQTWESTVRRRGDTHRPSQRTSRRHVPHVHPSHRQMLGTITRNWNPDARLSLAEVLRPAPLYQTPTAVTALPGRRPRSAQDDIVGTHCATPLMHLARQMPRLIASPAPSLWDPTVLSVGDHGRKGVRARRIVVRALSVYPTFRCCLSLVRLCVRCDHLPKRT